MRSHVSTAFLGFAVFAACSGQGSCGGCGAIEPLPDGKRLEVQKVDHAAALRFTDGGFEVLNQNWELILAQFAPGQTLTVPMPCTVTNVTAIGNVAVADMGEAGCQSEACGLMDGVCDGRDVPRMVDVVFKGLSFAPLPPDSIVATVEAEVSTGTFYVDSVSRNHLLCLFNGGGPFKCGVAFDTAQAAPVDTRLGLQLKMVFDERWDRLIHFEVADIGGGKACSSSESPPNCIDPDDLTITSAATPGSCGSVCGSANWEPVKGAIIGQVVSSLKKTMQKALDGRQCQSCSGGEPACPSFGSATSSCELDSDGTDAGLCHDEVTAKCVPAIFGIEGRVNLATASTPMLSPETSPLDVSLALGGSVVVDTGVNLAFRGAAREVSLASCVPTLAPLPIVSQPAPDFDQEALGPYDVALSVSRQYLDQLGHHAEQGGALCVTLNTETLPVLNSGLFKTLLPSLGLHQGEGDVPMAVVLRPQKAPAFKIGKGEVDAEGKLLSPLVALTMKDLELDFYALLHERYVRLFTLVVDLDVPFALQFEGCDLVQPIIGSLEGAVVVTGTKNGEILAEDLAQFSMLVPTFIALAEPALSGGLPQFTLPDFGAFKAQIVEAHGVNPIGGTANFQHMGLYARLLPSDAQCAGVAPSMVASVREARIPDERAMRSQAQWPVAVVDVEANVTGALYQYRVNGGVWSTLRGASAEGSLEISHPAFVVEGTHRIELRARATAGRGLSSAPVALGFTVDWSAPRVDFKADRLADRLNVVARDVVTRAEALEFSYRVGAEAFSPYGPSREVILSAIEDAGGLTVRVRDAAGHVGEAEYRVAGVVQREEVAVVEAQQVRGGGCGAAGGGLAWMMVPVVLGAIGLRRRK